MAITLAMLVAVMTASSNKKLPKVSRPIESGNDRIRCRTAASAGGMVNGTGLKTAIYTMYSTSGREHAEQGGMTIDKLWSLEMADFRRRPRGARNGVNPR
jgi:hypothetical protein